MFLSPIPHNTVFLALVRFLKKSKSERGQVIHLRGPHFLWFPFVLTQPSLMGFPSLKNFPSVSPAVMYIFW